MKDTKPEKGDSKASKDDAEAILKAKTEDIQVNDKDETVPSEESLNERLEHAEKEAKENYDRLLRVSAEFENYKKRMTREKEDHRRYANESLLKALLPVVDNLERAIHSTNEEERAGNPVVQGVELTLTEILNVFEKFAVKPISALKEPFDPVYHQAVMQEASEEHSENIVVKELQKGYLIHDRLLRPAMVVVSKASGQNGEPQEPI